MEKNAVRHHRQRHVTEGLVPQRLNVIHDLLKLFLADMAIFGTRVIPAEYHQRYETLHPFMDGNGRSGRALWAWQRLQRGESPFALGFLWAYYYETLQQSR